VPAIIGGDRGPLDFSALYRAHARDVHRFALFLTCDPAVAADVVSETFVRAWHAQARLDLTTVKGYLFTIARNLCLQQKRRASRLQPLDDRMAGQDADPGVRMHAQQELRIVLEAMQELPEVDRAAVLMRANDDMPYEDIASALGISVSAAKVKVHRARLKLAEVRRSAERALGSEEA
jgi:RNA polymerase sigma-70 factor (ECF subfamily)